MMNIVNGGGACDNPIDIQEFIDHAGGGGDLPRGHPHRLGDLPHAEEGAFGRRPQHGGIGDEGGFAPNLKSTREALDFILKSIDKAGYTAGDDVMLALDCARTEYFRGRQFTSLAGEGTTLTPDENVAYLSALCDDYPILSIEDGCAEDDWDGWAKLTEILGEKVQLVGDDLFVTNPIGSRRASPGAVRTPCW